MNLTQPDQSRMVQQGRGRPQLLAVEQLGLRRHPHHLDPQLGGFGGRWRRADRLQAPVIRIRARARPSRLRRRLLRQHRAIRCSSSTACAATPDGGDAAVAVLRQGDVNEAYAAASAKIDLDKPAHSRLVVRLREESHNCWSDCCAPTRDTMQAAIQAFANGIRLTPVDPRWSITKALTLYDGTVASGGNRYDSEHDRHVRVQDRHRARTVFDTSGVEPALNLNLSGDIDLDGRLGHQRAQRQGPGHDHGQQQAARPDQGHRRVLHRGVGRAGQRHAGRLRTSFSYSGGVMSRNVTLAQRSTVRRCTARRTTGANGDPALPTAAADEDAQASLQHVVLTYDPVNGRRIYVNGKFTGDVDPRAGGTLADWDDTFALVLGNESLEQPPVAGRDALRRGPQPRADPAADPAELRRRRRRALLPAVQRDAPRGVPQSYIMFEVSQYDSYSYLFKKPTFISLDPAATPGLDPDRGHAHRRQRRRGRRRARPMPTLDTTVTDCEATGRSGQLLSDVGTIIGLQKGPVADQFFLSFDRIGTHTNVRSTRSPLAPAPPADLRARSDIGVRTFEQLNQSMSSITGVPTTNPGVRSDLLQVQQQLPPVPSIEAFLASHQIGVAQLAIKYCSVMVENSTAARPRSSRASTSAQRRRRPSPRQARTSCSTRCSDACCGPSVATEPDASRRAHRAGRADHATRPPAAVPARRERTKPSPRPPAPRLWAAPRRCCN